jgi:hypothetical protein
MKFIGTLVSLDNNKRFPVYGRWFANIVNGMILWPGWACALDDRTIEPGGYTLKLDGRHDGLIHVVGHDATLESGEVAIFEGQGRPPSLQSIG